MHDDGETPTHEHCTDVLTAIHDHHQAVTS
jgi:hypothetical protein